MLLSRRQDCNRRSQSTPELVVSSPLSRALQTAELAVGSAGIANRVCYEGFREINGWLLNAQRQSKSVLQSKFPAWDFDHLETEHDAQWEPVLEEAAACGERGYAGLQWLAQRPERSILLVAHGGILRFALAEHPNVVLKDARRISASTTASDRRSVEDRFHNCELRRYRMECHEHDDDRGTIVLTEIDYDHAFEHHNDEACSTSSEAAAL
jgi:broad specificity phosphatase PhoE